MLSSNREGSKSRYHCVMATAADTTPPKPAFRTVWPAILGLVGLDYFSTLAYQPSIAYEMAGRLEPLSDNVVVRWLSDIWNRQLVATLLLLSLNFVLWPIVGRGFTRRLIHVAGALVAIYLLLTALVIGSGLIYIARHPEVAEGWW